MTVFYLSVLLVFLAEMGDKTQFATVALAARYSPRLVLIALTIATLGSHLVSVFIGRAAQLVLPDRTINVIAGVAFIAFGLWTLRSDSSDEEDENAKPRFSPFFALLFTFFMTEMGDKTMLATVTLGAQYPNGLIAVWLGSTIGMVIADGLAVAVGTKLLQRIPDRVLRPGIAAIFILTGLATIARVVHFTSIFAT
ncbi:MAG TPA: TMEM165/GDT1 family protein [Thermoanaerobaculia bacterium]